jgi:hypothetical protein
MQINPVHAIPSDILRSILMLYSHLWVRLRSDNFFRLPHKRRAYTLFFSHTCHFLCLAYPAQSVTSREHKVSCCASVSSLILLSLSQAKNSFLSTQFSIALSLPSFPKVTYQFSYPSENKALRETLSLCRGSSAGFGCKRRPLDKKGSCECIEKILTKSRQWSVLQLGSLAGS